MLALLAAELKTLPNCLLIEGHTDATQYSSDASYSNWELSADRANSARRLLQQDGVRSDQVTQVRGYADQLLRVKNNPFDPSNRRISILVKNQEGPLPNLKGAIVAEGPPVSPEAPAKPALKGGATGAQASSSTLANKPSPSTGATPPKTPTKPPAASGLMSTLKGMMPHAK